MNKSNQSSIWTIKQIYFSFCKTVVLIAIIITLLSTILWHFYTKNIIDQHVNTVVLQVNNELNDSILRYKELLDNLGSQIDYAKIFSNNLSKLLELIKKHEFLINEEQGANNKFIKKIAALKLYINKPSNIYEVNKYGIKNASTDNPQANNTVCSIYNLKHENINVNLCIDILLLEINSINPYIEGIDFFLAYQNELSVIGKPASLHDLNGTKAKVLVKLNNYVFLKLYLQYFVTSLLVILIITTLLIVSPYYLYLKYSDKDKYINALQESLQSIKALNIITKRTNIKHNLKNEILKPDLDNIVYLKDVADIVPDRLNSKSKAELIPKELLTNLVENSFKVFSKELFEKKISTSLKITNYDKFFFCKEELQLILVSLVQISLASLQQTAKLKVIVKQSKIKSKQGIKISIINNEYGVDFIDQEWGKDSICYNQEELQDTVGHYKGTLSFESKLYEGKTIRLSLPSIIQATKHSIDANNIIKLFE